MGFINLNPCHGPSENFIWQEEVRLSDGRIIVATQKKSCQRPVQTNNSFGCIDRESWLTVSLPEFSSVPITWHEYLHPRVINVHKEHLYVIGEAPTSQEARLYGIYAQPISPYIGFVWENGLWKRISFEKIPAEIYSTNML